MYPSMPIIVVRYSIYGPHYGTMVRYPKRQAKSQAYRYNKSLYYVGRFLILLLILFLYCVTVLIHCCTTIISRRHHNMSPIRFSKGSNTAVASHTTNSSKDSINSFGLMDGYIIALVGDTPIK